jgi:nicotinate-nucleotide adenylyltransferase
MRLGIFGGTFDPVHYGHLLLAEQCREQCRLNEVWFLPAGIPPHKVAQTVASGTARAEMLELAIAGHPAFRVDRRELRKEVPCFTVETLAELQDEDPARELFFLMGADSLRDFPGWREPQRILQLAKLAVVNRGDQPAPDLEPLVDLFGPVVRERVEIVTIPGFEVSSTDIRQRILDGRSIRYMTPRAVECYLETHSVYRGP